MRIALAQVNPTVGDFSGNLQRICTFVAEAAAQKCDLVLFPELSLCGYPPEDLLLNRSFIESNRRYLHRLTSQSAGMNVICGYAGSKGGKVYNSAAVISGGALIFSYNKIALPNYGVFDEKRYFQSGAELPLLKLGDALIGLSICEDIWVCPGVSEQQAALGARLILNISASPYHMHKVEERIELLRDCARRNNCFVGYVNMVGGQDELVFDGASLVVDPAGKVIARAQQFREELLTVDIKGATGKAMVRGRTRDLLTRTQLGTLTVRQVEMTTPFRSEMRRPVKRRPVARLSEAEEVYQALVTGTRDYVGKNGFREVLIGFSGGIDSALVAAVAVDAVGREKVHALFMPSRYTMALSHTGVKRQAWLLGVSTTEIAIDALFEKYLEALQPFFAGVKPGLTEENIQARIRGNILMAFSNKFGYLVLNTSNKSEAAVGYTTLYGDMVGGFSVLKDIPKTMVYRICNCLNRTRGREMIAQEIIDRPPSAELKDGQFDSDSLPPYEILDEILRLYVELDWNGQDIVAQGFDKKTVARVIRMVGRAEYKRRQSPPGIKITPRAFGKDRRWPITNKF